MLPQINREIFVNKILLVRELNYRNLEIIPILEGIFVFERKFINKLRIFFNVNSDTMQNEPALEVQEELTKHNIIPEDSILSNYRQLQGGADTTIFEISFKNHSKKFVQRIYRPGSSEKHVEFEYNVQKTLFENNVSVPETYLIKLTPNALERPYFVMEKIEGTSLAEIFGNNPDQFEQLLYKYLQELHKIHSVDPSLFSQHTLYDIQKIPYAPIDACLTRRRTFFDKYPDDLQELRPVIDWLEKHKQNNPCEKLVVVHGDYHGQNIIVQENQDFKILDWSNADISDFRRDLGFATVATGSMVGEDLAPMIAGVYEEISEIKVENLNYFMILDNLFNMIRFYSGINNPRITNENEDTMNFFKSVRSYPLYLVEVIKETCNIELNQIEEYFELKD